MVALPQPWQPPWPAPYTIPYWRFTGNPALTDELGNTVESFAAMAKVDVLGWDLYGSQLLAEHEAEEKFQTFLMTQPDFWPAIRDRFGLPIPDNQMTLPTTMFKSDGGVSPGVFRVVGYDIEAEGFHRWHPANIILLKRDEG